MVRVIESRLATLPTPESYISESTTKYSNYYTRASTACAKSMEASRRERERVKKVFASFDEDDYLLMRRAN